MAYSRKQVSYEILQTLSGQTDSLAMTRPRGTMSNTSTKANSGIRSKLERAIWLIQATRIAFWACMLVNLVMLPALCEFGTLEFHNEHIVSILLLACALLTRDAAVLSVPRRVALAMIESTSSFSDREVLLMRWCIWATFRGLYAGITASSLLRLRSAFERAIVERFAAQDTIDISAMDAIGTRALIDALWTGNGQLARELIRLIPKTTNEVLDAQIRSLAVSPPWRFTPAEVKAAARKYTDT